MPHDAGGDELPMTTEVQRFEFRHKQHRGVLHTQVSVVADRLLVGQSLRYGVTVPGPLSGLDLPLAEIVGFHLSLGFGNVADLAVVVAQGAGGASRRVFHLVDSGGMDGALYALRDALERLLPGKDLSALDRRSALRRSGVRGHGLAALVTILLCLAGFFAPMLLLALLVEERLAMVIGLPTGLGLFLVILFLRIRASLPKR